MFPLGPKIILTQLFQPYFYYSFVLVTISSICIKILLRYYQFLGRKTRSIFYLIPLIIPIILILFFYPETTTKIIDFVETIVISGNGQILYTKRLFYTIELPSITGILCLTGLILGVIFFLTMIFFSSRIATKLFHVIMLTPNEYSWLQESVKKVAQKFNIPTPKIGIVENLKPNAFIIGHGRKAILVFSIGLLNLLNEEELIAVISHELAHLKNQDFFFKILFNTLKIVSFFNPFAYIMASAAQKEREMLADESGAELLEQPKLLMKVLTKVYEALQAFPEENLLTRLNSNLFLVSSITWRSEILATHPQISQRIRNISESTLKANSLRHSNMIAVFVLSILIIFGGIITSYFLINIRTLFTERSLSLILSHQFIKEPKIDFMPDLKNRNIPIIMPLHDIKHNNPILKHIHIKVIARAIIPPLINIHSPFLVRYVLSFTLLTVALHVIWIVSKKILSIMI